MAIVDPSKRRIFRIVHVANVRGILERGGMHCRSSDEQDVGYVNIGNENLIERRSQRSVPIQPGGTLNDYVPFYFTPHSIMMYNIKTGRSVPQRDNRDIVVFISSIPKLEEMGLTFVFTNQHAYSHGTDFYSDVDDLQKIDWELLQRRDFKADGDDPGKLLRYQAEVLVYRYVPVTAMLAIGCYDDNVKHNLEQQLGRCESVCDIKILPQLYFEP